jgi:hypothetical protein
MEYPPESIGNCGIYEENVERDGCFGDLGWAWGDLRCGPFPGCRLSGSLMALSLIALFCLWAFCTGAHGLGWNVE